MKKFFSIFAFIAVAAIALTSCSKESDTNLEDGVKMKTITVRTGIGTKTTLDSDHSKLQWSTGDKISLFNNVDNDNAELAYTAGGYITVKVPATTTEIYAHYPYYEGNEDGPTYVSVYISNNQTQNNPGELNGYYFPMVAKGTVSSDNKALISFYPVASAFALNIYKTTLGDAETEMVTSVKVTPAAENTGFIKQQYMDLTSSNLKYNSTTSSDAITVTLTNPLTLSKTKPTDAQKFDGQIYVCLAKQSYKNVSFEITTTAGVYTITSNSTPFDCVNNDFVPININLARADFEGIGTAVLDWTFSGEDGSAGLIAEPGVTTNGLGSDYATSHSPYLVKFDNTGNYIQVHTDSEIGSVSIGYKMIGGALSSSIKIQESADGVTWSDVESLSISGSQNSIGILKTSNSFNTVSRFVKMIFTKGSNVGIGPISITKPWNLTGIEVTTQPTKTSYIVGESFDPTGMVVKATYVDANNTSNTKTEVITDYTYTPDGALSVSDNAITISYGGKTATVAITVTNAPAQDYLFHETFGNNPGKAREWNDSYSVKTGIPEVYSGITSYIVSNVKQGKNNTGSELSGLNQSSTDTEASIIIGPLNVANYSNLSLTYQWKAASIKDIYYTKLYYATSSNGTYTEIIGTGTGATTFVECSYSLPATAQVSTLYLKIVWRTSKTQAIIDEVELKGSSL